MKPFNLNSVVNPLAQRPSFMELSDHRIALPGVSSHEPLLRGCNQREWLARLVDMGIRHLVVPLNGREEDTCVYARRHPRSAGESTLQPAVGSDKPAPKVLYDLEHRDEGLFSRLQFLLDIAEKSGVLVGVSFFKISQQDAGPFAPGANVQGLSLNRTLVPGTDAPSGSNTIKALKETVRWIGSELRGRRGVWLEVFRGQGTAPTAKVALLEQIACLALAEALPLPPKTSARSYGGPWIAAPEDFSWSAATANLAAPFYLRRGVAPWITDSPRQFDGGAQHDDAPEEPNPELANSLQISALRRPVIYRFRADSDDAEKDQRRINRSVLWRAAMNGVWPIAPGGFASPDSIKRWGAIAHIATFCRQWSNSGYLRPCPELLSAFPDRLPSSGKSAAATDGHGRYFAYFKSGELAAHAYELLPGSYRYFWFDLSSGKGLDRGDGVPGGKRSIVPGHKKKCESLLILEQEELPDPMSVW